MNNVKPVYKRAPTEEEKQAITNLKNEITNCENEIKNLEEEMKKIEKGTQEHIRILHRYNEIKDLTQELLGNLATIRNTTTRKLYPDFGLDEED